MSGLVDDEFYRVTAVAHLRWRRLAFVLLAWACALVATSLYSPTAGAVVLVAGALITAFVFLIRRTAGHASVRLSDTAIEFEYPNYRQGYSSAFHVPWNSVSGVRCRKGRVDVQFRERSLVGGVTTGERWIEAPHPEALYGAVLRRVGRSSYAEEMERTAQPMHPVFFQGLGNLRRIPIKGTVVGIIAGVVVGVVAVLVDAAC